MSRALLFWFYKDPEVCVSRVEMLARHHPGWPIHGLFGGSQADAAEFAAKLAGRLDSFYVSPFTDPNWKWLHGDLVILDWFESQGRNLPWDQVAVIQWDLLLLEHLDHLLPGMRADQIFLSGTNLLTEQFERSWYWTSENGDRARFVAFREHVRTACRDRGELFQCGFILQVFPRLFFEKYATVPDREIGMLEYRVPTYARMLSIPFYERDIGVGNGYDGKPINAERREIGRDYIEHQLAVPGGWRIFHPYYRPWP